MVRVIPKNLKMVVFDLDDTLHFVNEYGNVENHIRDILRYFRYSGVKIALASNNALGAMFLYEYKIAHMFDAIETRKFEDECTTKEELDECKSGRKDGMFKRLMTKFSVLPENVLFFDDCVWNIILAKRMKIKSVCVDRTKCLTWSDVHKGLDMFKNKKLRRLSLNL